ncbi:glycosyltransferase family 4 protein [Marinobacter halodurans]|uniref:Glycosyltransferase family 4 protein n=1 Tax=Marinobacter halodurans TaxID=2528979 RepID=A0ABY1ZQC4_9GAMM|nr:glycosyltransferase [Marinobacter halodurans]TBW56712.1 glycosyltransferase family 4 protein [Marinobacter halodurans]
MKILVLTSTYSSNSSYKIPTFVSEQIKEISRQNPRFSFSILAPHDALLETSNHTSDNIRVKFFRYFYPNSLQSLNAHGLWPTIKKNPLKIIAFIFQLAFGIYWTVRLTTRTKPDLIYAHWFTPQGIAAFIASKLTNTPFAITSHSSDVFVLKKLPLIGPLLVKSALNQSSAISVVSSRTYEKIKCFYSEKEWENIQKKIFLLPMGVHLPSETCKQDAGNYKPERVLFIGRLTEKKGLQYLIPAFYEISKRFPKAALEICGSGPLENSILEAIEHYGLNEKVRLLGHIEGQDKDRILRNCKVFVTPSIITDDGDAEGLPVALLEGLSYGKICIATRESGADDIIKDGINGFLISQRSVSELESALSKALEIEADVHQGIEKNAKNTAKEYSWEIIGKKYTDFLIKASYSEKSSNN